MNMNETITTTRHVHSKKNNRRPTIRLRRRDEWTQRPGRRDSYGMFKRQETHERVTHD